MFKYVQEYLAGKATRTNQARQTHNILTKDPDKYRIITKDPDELVLRKEPSLQVASLGVSLFCSHLIVPGIFTVIF